ncbi:hypothetical protein [Flavobacterium sp.]|uniref:hypothetical protein n=1 Tax=Flavobacterium sp. TaxID=239 RepID=UPI00374D3595
MIKKIFRKLASVYFYVGVNIIRLPEIHIHKPSLIKRIHVKYKPVATTLKN